MDLVIVERVVDIRCKLLSLQHFFIRDLPVNREQALITLEYITHVNALLVILDFGRLDIVDSLIQIDHCLCSRCS